MKLSLGADEIVRSMIDENFADRVIDGSVIHNVETGIFCLREKATPEFIAEAKAAYTRFLAEQRSVRGGAA